MTDWEDNSDFEKYCYSNKLNYTCCFDKLLQLLAIILLNTNLGLRGMCNGN